MGDVHIFIPTACLSALITLFLAFKAARSSEGTKYPEGFAQHQRRYLIAWALGITGEWLGGPGVYALYASYGFTHQQTAQLFVLGFIFSSILGCFAGRFADRFGRKKSAMLYCIVGVIANSAKHVPWLPALFVGRFFDGLHASLLYTAFESWLVGDHNRLNFPPALVGNTFGLMYRVSYFSAIVMGVVAQLGVDAVPMFSVGPVHFGRWGVPLEMSATAQIICGTYILMNWDENYGGQQNSEAPRSSVMKALMTPQVLICGIMVAFFESCLFIFVFSWTPSLAPNGDKSKLPCGIIFSVYMMACMSGASTYSLLENGIAKHVRHSVKVLCVVALATVSLIVPSVMTVCEFSIAYNFLGFVVFEFCVGAYFPAAGALKSALIEEEHRTTIYNVLRTPMNLIVIAVLLLAPGETNVWRLMFCMLLATSVALSCYCMWEKPVKSEPLLGG